MFARQRRDAARIEELEASLEELRQEEEETRTELARESAARLDALQELQDLREFKNRADLADIQRRREEASALVEEELAERHRAMDEELARRQGELDDELHAAERENERKIEELRTAMRRAEEDSLRRRGQQQRAHRVRREELRRELDAYRDETQAEVRARVAAFGENYLYYLEQIRLLMERLSASSLEVGEALLTDDGADPTALFQRAMGDAIDAEFGPSTAPLAVGTVPSAAALPPEPATGTAELAVGGSRPQASPADGAVDSPESRIPGTGQWLDFLPRDREVQAAKVEVQKVVSTRSKSEGGDGDAPEVVLDEDDLLKAEIDELAKAIPGLRATHLAAQEVAWEGENGDAVVGAVESDTIIDSSLSSTSRTAPGVLVDVPATEAANAAPRRVTESEDVESADESNRDRSSARRSSQGPRRTAGDAIGEGAGRVWAVVSTVLFALLMVCVVWLVWLMLVEDLALTEALASMGATFRTWFGGAR